MMRPISLMAVLRRLAGAFALCALASTAAAAATPQKSTVKAAPQTAFQRVEIESLYTKGMFSSEPLMLDGYVLKPRRRGKTPAAVFAPACSGLMKPKGQIIRPWYRQMALHLKLLGITTLLVDGFNPRGREEICSQNLRSRTIDTEVRMKDSLAGLRFLLSQPDIDGGTIFLFTWGAAGGFFTMTRGIAESEEIRGGFKAAVMFYPRCTIPNDRLDAYAPVQVLVGEQDNWNPPGPCLALVQAKQARSASVDVKIYPGAYHGFDHPYPPKELPHVNEVVGRVIVGGNSTARKDAYSRVTQFVSHFLPR